MTKYWGPSTWFLFHTLAEKIKDDKFPEMKLELLSIIRQICTHLPCPECAGHAQAKLGTLDSNLIKTKHDLQLVLLSFHNFVNNSLGKPSWTEEQLNAKYRLAKMVDVVQYFIQIWTKPNPNPRLITYNYHKGQTVNTFIKWWNTHCESFDYKN